MEISLTSTDPETLTTVREKFIAELNAAGIDVTAGDIQVAPTTVTRTGPVDIATLILTIPPAIVAAMDIVTRMRAKQKAQQIINIGIDLTGAHTTVTVDTPHGKINITAANPTDLIEQANNETRNTTD